MSGVNANYSIIMPTSSPFGAQDAPATVLRMAASEAIRSITDDWGGFDRGSCFVLRDALFNTLHDLPRWGAFEAFLEIGAKATRHYTAFTGAHFYSTGFFGVGMARKTKEERREYRLEMLYYFWMAHQDM